MAALVLPPTVSLWVGNVAHTRRFPKRHAFRYPIHLMMVDPKVSRRLALPHRSRE